jgi:tRNA A-37 threonylcarbamoyl transferase component Bud32
MPWLNHGRRTWVYSQKLTGLTAPCLAWLHDKSGHGFLIFADLGQSDLYHKEQNVRKDDLPAAYAAAGKILAELHAHGVYHADTKTVNFVINDRLPWMSSPVLIIDCDDVHFHHSISKNHQVKNLVQFLALMGNLSHELITPFAADFKNGYQTTMKLSDTDMATLMAQVAERMKNDKSLENNLPA